MAAMAALAAADGEDNVWVAASDGNITKVQEFIEADPKMLSMGDENGYSPIHAAAAYGHHELLQLLVNAGADIHQRDVDGDTPLHHCDNPATAELLLSLGASPLIANNQGVTAPQLHLADEEDAMVEFWRSKGILEAGPIITACPEDFPDHKDFETHIESIEDD